MTRSRARQNPDQYTVIAAPLKIVKVLVEELLSASGNSRALDAQAAAELEEEGSDDGDWEDETNPFLDLGGSMTKERMSIPVFRLWSHGVELTDNRTHVLRRRRQQHLLSRPR